LYGDGSVLLVVSARPTSLGWIALRDLREISSPLVAFYFSSVCGSCIYAASCGAVAAVARIPGYPVCPQRDSSEQHKKVIDLEKKNKEITGQTVLFGDPANVKGIGWPSGERYSASGAVLYEAHRRTFFMQASIETCSVPISLTHLCAPITANFVRQHWMLPP
jgi:hypothetical protein